MMGLSDNFNRLDSLKIVFPDASSHSSVIYGNGRNQVKVTINVVIIDKSNNYIKLSDDDAKGVFLCKFDDGSALNKGHSDGWFYSNEENDFNGAVSYDTTVMDNNHGYVNGVNLIDFYISCDGQRDGMQFAAAISISDIGVFNTTQEGTNTPNGPSGTSSTFKMPSSVLVKALSPYRYKQEDFKSSSIIKEVPAQANQGCVLRDIYIQNFYFDIVKEGYSIKKVEASSPAGSIFCAYYSWWWVGHSWDFIDCFNSRKTRYTISLDFGKYSFPFDVNTEPDNGINLIMIYGTASLFTSWLMTETTDCIITDNYGNVSRITFSQNNSKDIIEITDIKYIDNNENYVSRHDIYNFKKSFPLLQCGLHIEGNSGSRFVSCQNISPCPDVYSIPPIDDINKYKTTPDLVYAICAMKDGSEKISEFQLLSDRTLIPVIVACLPSQRSINIYPNVEIGYVGRPYIQGKYDCYSLARDYLLQEKGIYINDIDRKIYLTDGKNAEFFQNQAKNLGFVKVEDGLLRDGDLIVININGSPLKHIAVYTGNNNILHHMATSKSCYEEYTKKWNIRTDSIWRHINII